MALGRDLEPPGSLTDNSTYDFAFNSVELPYETYAGLAVRVRYFINVVINRSYGKITKEEDFLVHLPTRKSEEVNTPVKLTIGIPDLLDLRLTFEKSKFHLKDAIVGSFEYKQFGIRIKHMELCIVKKEIFGPPSNPIFTDTKNIARYEIMDGGPIIGEIVPIRFYLSSVEGVTPSINNINNCLTCKYLINIILYDDEEKRYFKSLEVEMYRKAK